MPLPGSGPIEVQFGGGPSAFARDANLLKQVCQAP